MIYQRPKTVLFFFLKGVVIVIVTKWGRYSSFMESVGKERGSLNLI
jgi:hypothetical protein